MKWLIWIAALLPVLGCHGSVASRFTSPDGRTCIRGSYSKLFLVDVSSGRQLAPLFPPSQEGQVSNVALEVKWAPDSHKLAVKAAYGTRLNEVLLFRIKEGHTAPVAFDTFDLLRLSFGDKLGMDESDGYDENELGKWKSNDTISVLGGLARISANGTQHFVLPIQINLSKILTSSKSGKAKILSDSEYKLYLTKWDSLGHD